MKAIDILGGILEGTGDKAGKERRTKDILEMHLGPHSRQLNPVRP